MFSRFALQHTRRALTGLIAAALLWWLVTNVAAGPDSMLQRFDPVSAVRAVVELFQSGRATTHIVVTMQRLIAGLVIAGAIGVPLGVAVGRSQRLSELTGTLFQFLRMISPLAWTPVAIVLLGVGGAPVVFLVVAAAVWPFVISTAAGVKALDPGWLKVSTSLGANRFEQLRTVVLPGIRTHVATGARIALGTAWIVIVPAEMLGVDSGLGYAILNARDRLRYDELMAIVLLIGALGFLLDSVAQRFTQAGRRRSRTRSDARQSTVASGELQVRTAVGARRR